jgi:hypothetical protein
MADTTIDMLSVFVCCGARVGFRNPDSEPQLYFVPSGARRLQIWIKAPQRKTPPVVVPCTSAAAGPRRPAAGRRCGCTWSSSWQTSWPSSRQTWMTSWHSCRCVFGEGGGQGRVHGAEDERQCAQGREGGKLCARQQADLDEQLAFVQVCQYFKIFHKFARSGVCLHGDCIRD